MDYYEQLAIENHQIKKALMESQEALQMRDKIIICLSMRTNSKKKELTLKVPENLDDLVYNANGSEDGATIEFRRGTKEEAASWQEN